MPATIKIALVSRTIFYAPVWVAEQNSLAGCQAVHGERLLGEFFTVEL